MHVKNNMIIKAIALLIAVDSNTFVRATEALVNTYLTGLGIGGCVNQSIEGSTYPTTDILRTTGSNAAIWTYASAAASTNALAAQVASDTNAEHSILSTQHALVYSGVVPSGVSPYTVGLGIKISEDTLDNLQQYGVGDTVAISFEFESSPVTTYSAGDRLFGGSSASHASVQTIVEDTTSLNTTFSQVNINALASDSASGGNSIWLNAIIGDTSYVVSCAQCTYSSGVSSKYVGVQIPGTAFSSESNKYKAQILRVLLKAAAASSVKRVSLVRGPTPQNRKESNAVQGHGSTGYCEYMHSHGILGKNHIVGLTDTGIQMRHVAFYDEINVADNCYFDHGGCDLNVQIPVASNTSTQEIVSGTQAIPVNTRARKVISYLNYVDGVERKLNGHGTSVASAINGEVAKTILTAECNQDKRVNGIAPQSKIAFFDAQSKNVQDQLTSPLSLPFANTYDMFLSAYKVEGATGARVYVVPYGHENYGAYSTFASEIDRFMAENTDMLIVVAAGNDATSVTSPGVSKNALTVGAVNHAFADVADFSSYGVCDAGRQKPEIVAPGHSIKTPQSTPLPQFAQFTTNCDVRGDAMGTSMSAAFVGGAAVLVREYFQRGFYTNNGTEGACGDFCNPKASTIKATLIAASSFLAGTPDPTNSIGSNEKQGFGFPTLQNALPFSNERSNSLFVKEDTISTSDVTHNLDVTDSSKPLEVILAYTDPVQETGVRNAIVNNLHLHVCHGVNFQDCDTPGLLNNVQTNSNVQKVIISNPSGTYQIKVTKGTSFLTASQDFSIVATYGGETIKAAMCCPPNAAYGVGGVDCIYTSQVVMISLTLLIVLIALIFICKNCNLSKKSAKKVEDME